MHLTCPVCRDPLALEDRTYRCPRGHAFDRAREGYVDLLPVGHGRTGITGDTRDMARARQRFLGAGHYDRLVGALVERAIPHLGAPRVGNDDGSASAVIAEAGCGSGHYIAAVAAAAPGAVAYGFDVSPEALRVAARAHPAITFAVNDVNHRLCLANGSVDVLLDVFAPRNAAEFRRVLRDDGLLLIVIPGEAHLAELRAELPLLGVEPGKRDRTLASLAPTFELAREEELEWAAELGGDAVADLVRMSPSAFHIGDDILARVAGCRVTFSFRVLGLRPA